MAADRETAFFNFGTNAPQTASEIEQGMQRISAAMRRLDGDSNPGQVVDANTAGLRDTFRRIETDAYSARERVRGIFADLRSGLITPDQVQPQFERVVRETIGTLPGTIGTGLARAGNSVFATVDATKVGREWGSDIVRGLSQEAQNLRKANVDLLGGVPMSFAQKNFAKDITAYGQAPVNFNDLATEDYLRNRLRIEQSVRADLDFDQTGLTTPNIDAMRRRMGSGIDPVVSDIFATSVFERDDEDASLGWAGSDTAQRINELNRLTAESQRQTRDHTRATREFNAELDREARKAHEASVGLQALAASQVRGGVILNDGRFVTPTQYGAAESSSTYREGLAREDLARQQEEARNRSLLVDNFDRIDSSVRGYDILDDDVYKKTSYGHARVTDAYELERVYERQDAVLTRQAATQERLAHTEGRRALHAQQNQSGALGGFLGRFHRNDQDFATSLGGQIASAAAFSFAYGSLFALQAALRDTMAEFLDYQDSLTDLEVATRSADVVTADWTTSLSQLSRLSGANMGAAMDTAARGIRAFTEFGDSPERIREVGDAVTEASTKLALIAGKDLTDATGDVIAAGSAFGLDPDQISQVTDAVANAKRNVGGDANQISQGLSLIALSAQEAGFNLNEAAAVMGLVQARTDQSGQAIATRLTRIFQIISGSTGKGLAAELDVDPTQSVKEQIEAFAEIYSNPGTSEAVKDRISSALGGTANLRELLPLLTENTTLQNAYEEALNNAGQGTDEFNRKSENLVGTLKKITGNISNIQVRLGDSGLFDFVGGGLQVLEPALNALDLLLAGINNLTDEIPYLQTVLGTIVDITIAAKIIGTIQGKNQLFTAGVGGAVTAAGAAGDAAGIAARSRETTAIVTATQARLVAEGRMNEAIALSTARRSAVEAGGTAAGGIRGGLATLGRFASNPATLLTAAIVGGFFTVGKILEDKASGDSLDNKSTDSFRAFLRVDGSAASMEQAALDLRSAAGEIKGLDTAGITTERRDDTVRAINNRAEGVEYLAARVAQETNYSNALQQTSAFGTGAIDTVQQLAEGMGAIAADGGTALTQMQGLRKALLTPPPDKPVAQPVQVATQALLDVEALLPEAAARAQAILDKAASQAPPNDQFIPTGGGASDPFGETQYQGRTNIPNKVAVTDLGPEVQEEALNTLLNAMEKQGIDPANGLTEGQITRLKAIVANKVPLDLGEETALVREQLLNMIFEQLDAAGGMKNDFTRAISDAVQGLRGGPQAKALADLGVPPGVLNDFKNITRANVLNLLTPSPDGTWGGIGAAMEAGLAAIPTTDGGSLYRQEVRGNLDILQRAQRGLKRTNQEPVASLELAIANMTDNLQQSQVERIEDLREAAESRAKTNRQLREVRLQFAKQAFRKATGNPNLLEQLMESMDRRTIEAVIDYLRSAVQTARMAYQHAARIHNAALAVMRAAGEGAGLEMPSQDALQAAGKKLERKQAALQEALKVMNGAANITEDIARLPDDGAEEAEKEKKTAAERAQERAALISAQAQARAARLGGGIASAQAAITSAKAEIDAAKKGTPEYFSALASFYQAQWQLKDAMLAYRGNILALEGDNTDPVEQARDALQLARMRLAQARSKDDRAAARVEVESSEVALQQAKWDQKLSDMQMAEQLGKISYAQYIRYLERESGRMHQMRGKTRAQIDRMNEIDLALKEATESAAGQFNLGDIDTRGFVYQIRRFAAEQRATMSGSGGANPSASVVNNNQQIVVNGADVAEVRKIIREVLGNARTRSTGSARRV